jgi:hypothetical protein
MPIDSQTGQVIDYSDFTFELRDIAPGETYPVRGSDGTLKAELRAYPANAKKRVVILGPGLTWADGGVVCDPVGVPVTLRAGESYTAPNGQVLTS